MWGIRAQRTALVSFALILAATALAQQTGAGGGKGSAGRVATRSTSPTTINTTSQQPVFYAGRVVLDTGIAPPSAATIVRVCNGISRRETYTSADGFFSFMLGDRFSETTPDASDDPRGFTADSQFSRSNITALSQGAPQTNIADCEVHADLVGYTSTSIHLDPSLNNASIGIIMLHSRVKKADGMVTVASLAVPGKARHEFEKGSEQLEKGNLAEAEKSLRKAIEEYPRFAEAWTRLGDLEQRRKDPAAAAKDYEEAISSDPNLPLPYLRLAYLDAIASRWEETRQLTEKLISLDPVDFLLAYYYNAAAEFNLKHVAKAESSCLRAEAMDKQHSEPRIEILLASIYVSKESYPQAIEHYQAFLKLVPNGPLSDRVKVDIAKIDQIAKSQPAPATPAAPANDK